MLNRLKAALLGVTILSGITATAHADTATAVLGRAEASRPVTFEVMLPLRNRDQLAALLRDLHDPKSASYHKWLTPAEFGRRFGADAATMDAVAGALSKRGFAITRHTISLHGAGTAAAAEQAFGARLMLKRAPSGHTLVVADNALKLPAELTAAGAHVIAFTGHEAHPMSQKVTAPLDIKQNRYGSLGPYWYDDLKQAYGYPSVLDQVTAFDGTTKPLDGTGVSIGVLITNDVLDSDIQLIFDHELWTQTSGKPDPTLYARVLVNGGAPYDPNASFEASLDVQQELSGAPGAHVTLYNIPDLSDTNIMAGYTQIIDDNKLDLVSSSFGGCELQYFPKYNMGMDMRYILDAYDALFLQGNAQGITFLASSGDSAGKECPTVLYFQGQPGGRFVTAVDSPSDDPNVTAVGGTNLVTVYKPPLLGSAYSNENTWSDPENPYDPYGIGQVVTGGFWSAGGGTSQYYTAPSYQSLVSTTSTMRAIPDIGMQVGGCPGGGLAKLSKSGSCNGLNSPSNGNGNTDRSAAVVALGGALYGVIGTSVASPEFAGAAALLIEQKGRMGNLNPYIYQLAQAQSTGGRIAYHTGIPGYNGVIQANVSPTYSVAAGVGTPYVRVFIGLPSVKLAGQPQTADNP